MRCTWGIPAEELRFAHIPNTLEIGEIYVSQNVAEELAPNGASIEGEPEDLAFDDSGNLTAFTKKP